MRVRFKVRILCVAVLLSCCAAPRPAESPAKLTVAAAANLTDVFGEVGRAFTAKTGVEVVFSYASTAQLATQIDNGAPFDLFAAADVEHVDALVSKQKLASESRAIYALGQLALWIPAGEQRGVRELRDLSKVRFVAIAQPELAPYGQAAVDVLNATGLWDIVRPKLVYGTSISMAKQYAASGSADAVFTAYSLVLHEKGTILKIDPSLHQPIEQALGIVSASPHSGDAEKFRTFLLGLEGQTILTDNGYLLP